MTLPVLVCVQGQTGYEEGRNTPQYVREPPRLSADKARAKACFENLPTARTDAVHVFCRLRPRTGAQEERRAALPVRQASTAASPSKSGKPPDEPSAKKQ
ncbi:hypothetical protein ON010_g18304 [Phytophthora cinnamomi]|nr:hypothetical protein ON010_g18304 [Phytophthora cinnamomi]